MSRPYRVWVETSYPTNVNLQRVSITHRRGIMTPSEATIEYFGDEWDIAVGNYITLTVHYDDGSYSKSDTIFEGWVKRVGYRQTGYVKNPIIRWAELSSGTNRKFMKKVDVNLFNIVDGITKTDIENAGIEPCPDFGTAREFQFRGRYLDALERCFKMAGKYFQAGPGSLNLSTVPGSGYDLNGVEIIEEAYGVKVLNGGVIRGTLNAPKMDDDDVVIYWSPCQEQWWNVAAWSDVDDNENYFAIVVFMGYIHHPEVIVHPETSESPYGTLELDGTDVDYSWYKYSDFKSKRIDEIFTGGNSVEYAIVSPEEDACYSYLLIKKIYPESEAKTGNIFAKFKKELPKTAKLVIHGEKLIEYFTILQGDLIDVELTEHVFPSIENAQNYLNEYLYYKNMTSYVKYRWKYGMKQVVPTVSHEPYDGGLMTEIVDEVRLSWNVGGDLTIEATVLKPSQYEDPTQGDSIGDLKDFLRSLTMKIEGRIVKYEYNGAVVVIRHGEGENAKEYRILKALPYAVMDEKRGIILQE